MTVKGKFCSFDPGIGYATANAAAAPAPQASAAWMQVEIVADEGRVLSDECGHILAILQGRGAVSPELCNLRGEQADLEKVAAADLVLVYGDDTAKMCRAVESMRAARLVFPIVAFREVRCQPDNAELLRAGYDDVIDPSMPLDEVIARLRSLHERAQVYERRLSQGLSLRRGGKAGDERRDVFSGRERAILTVLQENQGRIVSYEEILARIGKEPTARAIHTLQVTMSGLRQKLSDEWKVLGINRTGYILVMSGVAQSDMPEQVFG